VNLICLPIYCRGQAKYLPSSEGNPRTSKKEETSFIAVASRAIGLGEFLPLRLLIYFGQFFNCRSSPNFRLLFSQKKMCINLDWAIIWVIFTQNHLVTLIAVNKAEKYWR
jgi:hypothetical protein